MIKIPQIGVKNNFHYYNTQPNTVVSKLTSLNEVLTYKWTCMFRIPSSWFSPDNLREYIKNRMRLQLDGAPPYIVGREVEKKRCVVCKINDVYRIPVTIRENMMKRIRCGCLQIKQNCLTLMDTMLFTRAETANEGKFQFI